MSRLFMDFNARKKKIPVTAIITARERGRSPDHRPPAIALVSLATGVRGASQLRS